MSVNFIETEYGMLLSTSYIKRIRKLGLDDRKTDNPHRGKALMETTDGLRYISSQDFDVVAKLLEFSTAGDETCH
jgi:hypothetical protein